VKKKSEEQSLSGITTNLALLIAALTGLSSYTQGKGVSTMLIDGVVVFAVAQIVLELGYLVVVGIQRSLREREAEKKREEVLEDS
jgi:hypothetical protein